MRFPTIVGSLLCGLLALPLASPAQETQGPVYWQGWCAGRQAGLEHASTYVHTVRKQVIAGLGRQPHLAATKEAFEHFFFVSPFTSFGPPLEQLVSIDLPDGRTIRCPDGQVTTTRPPHRQG